MTAAMVRTVLRWEEPPPAGASTPGPRTVPSCWSAVAEELRAHPRRWAAVYEGPLSSGGWLVNRITRGGIDDFPAGDFDACSRSVGARRVVYARYLGDGEW